MPTITTNDIEIYYEQVGDPSARALLLISGLGAQLTGWPDGFVGAIAERGFFVTIFDNRDVGLSTWFDHLGVPDVASIMSGEEQAPYILSDLAADAAGLVRGLDLGPVDVVGVSMGGMIAQQFAIDHPELTRSLTSIMSTPAINDVGQPTPEALAMLTTPRSEDLDTFLDEEVANWKLTNGSRFELDEDWVRRQAIASMERGRNPDGVARQMAAIVSSPDRRPLLANVDVPSVVIHGDEDPLVTPSGGVATADAIPGAKLVIMEGVGHSLPEGIYDDVISEIERVASLAR